MNLRLQLLTIVASCAIVGWATKRPYTVPATAPLASPSVAQPVTTPLAVVAQSVQTEPPYRSLRGREIERLVFEKYLESPERQKILRDHARLMKMMRQSDIASLRAASKSYVHFICALSGANGRRLTDEERQVAMERVERDAMAAWKDEANAGSVEIAFVDSWEHYRRTHRPERVSLIQPDFTKVQTSVAKLRPASGLVYGRAVAALLK